LGASAELDPVGGVVRRRAQFRACAIRPAAIAEVAGSAEQYRHIWNHRFDRMDAYVQLLQDMDRNKER
jgi:hypothetical protein